MTSSPPMPRWRVLPLAMCLIWAAADAEAGEGKKDGRAPRVDVAQLATKLSSDLSFKVRLQAAVVLGRSGDPEAVEPLLSALHDDHFTVRGAACVGLANLKDARAIPSLLRVAATDEKPEVRVEARRALKRFDPEPAWPFLSQASNGSDVEVREEAIALIAERKDDRARLRLVEALGDVDPVREIAQNALSKLGEDAMIGLLRMGLDSPRTSVRLHAALMLGDIASPKTVAILMDTYEQEIENDELRRAVRDTLRSLRRLMPAKALIAAATNPADRIARARALKFLGVLGGDEAMEILLDTLKDPDVYLRGVAALALAETGDTRAIAPLNRLIEDESNARIAQIVRNSVLILQRKATPLRD